MIDKFVDLNGMDYYQDYWLNMRMARTENFQSDIHILNKHQEEIERDIEKIIKEKERIFKMIKMLKSTVKTGSDSRRKK